MENKQNKPRAFWLGGFMILSFVGIIKRENPKPKSLFLFGGNMFQYDQQEEPLVISKSVMDLFLKYDNVIDLIALYTFYYYTAKWQKTNQCKCTDSYAQNGLKMPRKRHMTAKKILLENNLIDKVQRRGKNENGKISILGWYIKVNFMWTKEKVNKVLTVYDKGHGCTSSQVNKYTGEQVHTEPTNALSSDIKNALSTNKEMSPLKNDKFLYLSEGLKKRILIESPSAKITESQLGKWANEFRLMVEQDDHSEDFIKSIIIGVFNHEFWKKNIRSASSLRAKLNEGRLDEVLKPAQSKPEDKTQKRRYLNAR